MKGKVVLVRFPFDDFSATKVRPAVCLTDPIGSHRHVILAFITSRIPDERHDSDIVFRETDSDFAAAGLRATSTLRLHRLMTASTALILRELGALSSKRMREVERRLQQLFSLHTEPTAS